MYGMFYFKFVFTVYIFRWDRFFIQLIHSPSQPRETVPLSAVMVRKKIRLNDDTFFFCGDTISADMLIYVPIRFVRADTLWRVT